MFEELDFRQTALGDLVLRRRESVSTPGLIVHEVLLDGEFLMSSAVNDSEIALASLGLEAVEGPVRSVLVGGLGLGHTAAAALDHPTVERLTVVELLDPILQWHLRRRVPLGERLVEDGRCELRQGDFFDFVAHPPDAAEDRFDAILVDIDHSPSALLSPAHARFYRAAGLGALALHLRPGGALGLWSADAPEAGFLASAERAFRSVTSHRVEFYSPFLGEEDVNWVIVAQV